MTIEVTGIHHCCISVPSIEETVEWYERVLGFVVAKYSEIPDTGIRVCHMQAPGFLLEIMQAPDAEPLPAERGHPHTDVMTHGHKHFSVGVKDGPATKAALESMGIEVILVGEVDNTYSVFVRDNAGNLVEFSEV
ncbi:MAG: VOC family protein [Armatimonadetes bacterium]|nr:VOC family protein [Armatimonadota bacterium]